MHQVHLCKPITNFTPVSLYSSIQSPFDRRRRRRLGGGAAIFNYMHCIMDRYFDLVVPSAIENAMSRCLQLRIVSEERRIELPFFHRGRGRGTWRMKTNDEDEIPDHLKPSFFEVLEDYLKVCNLDLWLSSLLKLLHQCTAY